MLARSIHFLKDLLKLQMLLIRKRSRACLLIWRHYLNHKNKQGAAFSLRPVLHPTAWEKVSTLCFVHGQSVDRLPTFSVGILLMRWITVPLAVNRGLKRLPNSFGL